MAWPPLHMTLDQGTKIQGSVMFKKGSLITSDGQDVMKIIKGEVINTPQDRLLITEDEKLIVTEDNNDVLV